MKFLWVTISIIVMATWVQTADGQEWKPFTAAELASGPVVEKDADAEALFWDIHIEQSLSRTVLSHYIRIKIFTDRGVESQGRVDLPYGVRTSIKDITARTIQPDGTVIALKPDATFERTILKTKKAKVEAKSFALANVKPGALIEYRWTEVIQDTDPLHLPLIVQRDIPVRLLEFSVKPMSDVEWPLRVKGFNVGLNSTDIDKRGNRVGSVGSIPAFHEEPFMPPESAVQAWLLIYYDVPDFWNDYGRYLSDAVKSRMKVTDDVRREATKLAANSPTEEEKLRRLYEFCRTEIRHIDDEAIDDPVQRAADLAARENKIPADTLKRKAGTGADIDYLFASLANASGFDVRYALLSNRGRFLFDENYPTPHMLTSYNIAVRLDNQWRFFDPAGRYLPFGMLRWQQEGVPALLVNSDRSYFVTTPSSAAEKAVLKRSMVGHLEPDGTLEGDVRLVFFGHLEAEEKEAMDSLAPNQREEYIRMSVQGRVKAAEISDVQVTNVTDRQQPIVETYHIRVPGYAQRIGKRLFFEPGYFQHGKAPMLSSSTRIYPVYFPSPWIEDDMVSLELPQGFALDNADQPAPESAAGTTVKHEIHVAITNENTLRFERRLSFGIDKKIFFSVSEYPSVKSVLDAIGKRDGHVLAIKESTPQEEKPQ